MFGPRCDSVTTDVKIYTHEQNTSSKVHPDGCNWSVHDSRVCYFFRLLRIECKSQRDSRAKVCEI